VSETFPPLALLTGVASAAPEPAPPAFLLALPLTLGALDVESEPENLATYQQEAFCVRNGSATQNILRRIEKIDSSAEKLTATTALTDVGGHGGSHGYGHSHR
jgi:hypothetical protein